MEKVELFSKIEKIIFNNPATIVLFNDDTKSVAKCNDNDVYDPFKGYLTALIKHILPSEYNLVNLLKNKKYRDLYFDSGYNKNTDDCYTTLYERYNLDSSKICAEIYRGRLNGYNYDTRTRKLLCLLSYFSKDYCEYKHVYIDEMNKLLSSKPEFYINPKNHANVDFYNVPNSPLYDNRILKLVIDAPNIFRNSILPPNSIHIDCGNDVDISKVIKETLDDYFNKQTYTVTLDINSKNLARMMHNHDDACGLDARTMYPHYDAIDALNNLKENLSIKRCGSQRNSSCYPFMYGMMPMDDFIKKVGENIERGFRESLNKQHKIDYSKYTIDRSKNHTNNAVVYNNFLAAFNSTGEWNEEECLQHGLLGLMSELGELKEVLTKMLYTSNYSDDMYTHLHRELSDICWMLCEYTSYIEEDLGHYTFPIFVGRSIDFHNSNNTKYLHRVNPITYHYSFSIAIGIVDDMMLNATKIANIHQKILQGHAFGEFKEQHRDIMLDIYINLQYISQYIFTTDFTTLFDISMKKVKNRYPDGWMDPQRSINRRPEDI